MRYSKIALRHGYRPQARAIGSAGERLVHTEEVTGSIPVSPTLEETKQAKPPKHSNRLVSYLCEVGWAACRPQIPPGSDPAQHRDDLRDPVGGWKVRRPIAQGARAREFHAWH
jgi:hypothetical protein